MRKDSEMSSTKIPVETARLPFPTDLLSDMLLGYACILIVGSSVKFVWQSLQSLRRLRSSSRQDSPNRHLTMEQVKSKVTANLVETSLPLSQTSTEPFGDVEPSSDPAGNGYRNLNKQ